MVWVCWRTIYFARNRCEKNLYAVPRGSVWQRTLGYFPSVSPLSLASCTLAVALPHPQPSFQRLFAGKIDDTGRRRPPRSIDPDHCHWFRCHPRKARSTSWSTPVIGEVIAGLALGPSLLGAIDSDAMHLLVPNREVDPHQSVAIALKVIAQLGVVLYMFLVGLELNAAHLKQKAHAAVAISHASIVVPFSIGALLSLWLYPLLAEQGVPFVSFALFFGVAMSITAFPVLARILTDNQMQQTPIGTIALSCAAADDVTAWCLLSLVVGVAKAEIGYVLFVVVGALAFIAVMLFFLRPLLLRYLNRLEATQGGQVIANTCIYILVLGAAAATEWIGIHAIFGPFLLGVALPADSSISRGFLTKLKEPVTILLLPAFFAYTGLRTEIGLLHGWSQWGICLVIILVATMGKFGGTLFAARLAGEPWREASILGMLMNTRGLMELIVLNIGLDLGIISPTLFAMMVLMALVTT